MAYDAFTDQPLGELEMGAVQQKVQMVEPKVK